MLIKKNKKFYDTYAESKTTEAFTIERIQF